MLRKRIYAMGMAGIALIFASGSWLFFFSKSVVPVSSEVSESKSEQSDLVESYDPSKEPFEEITSATSTVSARVERLMKLERMRRLPVVRYVDHPVRVPIFMYHRVAQIASGMSITTRRLTTTPETFELQLAYLRDHGYTTIFLRDLIRAMQSGKKIPERPVVLTFDDGTRDFYTTVLPLLKKYDMKAVAYVNSDITTNPRFLNAEMIREASGSGHVEIASHTSTHPFLNLIQEEPERLEITESKKKLESIIGEPVVSFAYPFGAFTSRTIDRVRDAGYESAASAYPGTLITLKYRYELPRLLVGEAEKVSGFVRKLEKW